LAIKLVRTLFLLTMKPLIIFDLDGTLYVFDDSNSVNFISSRFYAAIKNNAYNFLQKRLGTDLKRAKGIYETIKQEFDGEVSLGLETRYRIDRYEWFESTWNLNPGDFLKPENKKSLFDSLDAEIAILTAAPKVWASRALDYLGLAEYQNRLFTGEPDLRKPNPEVFKQICDSIGIPLENSVSIGDQVASDILPAKSLGMRTILVRSYSVEADYCIDSLERLPNLWRRIIR